MREIRKSGSVGASGQKRPEATRLRSGGGHNSRLFLRIGEGSCCLGEELGDSFCSSDGVDGHEAEVVEYAT
jgi:hypothetical protein